MFGLKKIFDLRCFAQNFKIRNNVLLKAFNKILNKVNKMLIVKVNKVTKINRSISIFIQDNLLIINSNFTIKNKMFIIINNIIINQIDNMFYKAIFLFKHFDFKSLIF